MKKFLDKSNKLFDLPLGVPSRLLVIASAIALIGAFIFPLWNMTFTSTQYPDGLRLYIYSGKLAGQVTLNRVDLEEINNLNHYIGMRPLMESDFPEFTYLPFIFGVLILLALRAVVLGKTSKLVDLFILILYIGIFSVFDFHNKLYAYGHNLNPQAAIKIQPFTPPLFGTNQLAQFTVDSYPALGSVALFLCWVMLFVALILQVRMLSQSETLKQQVSELP